MIKISLVAVSMAALFSFSGCFSDNTPEVSISTIEKLGSFKTNVEGGSEIVAFSKTNDKMYVTNGENNRVDIINISDVTSPTLDSSIDMSPYGTGINSVAVQNGVVAVAVQNGNSTVGKKQLKGKVVLFDINGTHQKTVEAGYLPDMVTFNEDGTKVIVANEGEPNDAYTVDPIGSVGIVTVADGSYVDIDFSNATLTNANDGTAVRLGGTPSNDKAKDLEPEYVTVSGNYAYVSLQENNAMAKIDLSNNRLSYVKSYGAKSYEIGNSTIDIEEEGSINMKNYKGLFGLYQPDSIASYIYDNNTFVVTANEGDGREYIVDAADTNKIECENTLNGKWDSEDGCISFIDEKKISKLTLDKSIASEYADENDLKVMTDMSTATKLYTYGARSFSIWDSNGDLVFDSGDEISKKVAEFEAKTFNQDDGDMDGRSGNKGAEPEALTVGQIGSKTYAFIGLERQNAIMIYDITDPNNVSYINYIKGNGTDISPEGMKFIPASESPNDKNLLLVSYEVSGSTVIYEVK